MSTIDIGILASLGIAEIQVYRPLNIALIATGDELKLPGQILNDGDIFASNSYFLAAILKKLNVNVIDFGVVNDDFDAIKKAFVDADKQADAIISSGGVSVGDADYTKDVLDELGEISFWKVAIKPGKPFAFGRLPNSLFFGLPGNPVSSFVTFLLIARPYLLKLQGCTDTAMFHVWARANFDRPAGNRREYLRVQLNDNGGTELEATVYAQQGSGVMSSVSWANGLAEQEVDQVINTGDWLKVYPLS